MAARGRVGSHTCRTARGPWPETRCAPWGHSREGSRRPGSHAGRRSGAPVSGLRLPGHRDPRPSGPGCQRAAPTVRKGDVMVTCSLRLSEPIRPAIAWAHRTAAIQRQAPRALAGCAGPVIRESVWLTGVLSLGLSALGKSHVKEYLPTCSRPSDQRNLLVFGRSKNQHLLMVR